ncbi:hypothetical protein BKA81DRAFT_113151 [Phyllosticta paracitricarpa]
MYVERYFLRCVSVFLFFFFLFFFFHLFSKFEQVNKPQKCNESPIPESRHAQSIRGMPEAKASKATSPTVSGGKRERVCVWGLNSTRLVPQPSDVKGGMEARRCLARSTYHQKQMSNTILCEFSFSLSPGTKSTKIETRRTDGRTDGNYQIQNVNGMSGAASWVDS